MECIPSKALVRQDNNIQAVKQVLVAPENFSQTALDVIPGYRMSCRFFSDNSGKSRVIQLVRLGQYA